MLLKTSPDLRHQLLDKPESGMGYQIALVNGKRYAIFNADLAVPILHLPLHLPLFLPDLDSKSQIDPHAPATDNGRYSLRLIPIQPDSDAPPLPHSFGISPENSRALASFAEDTLATEDPDAPIEKLPPLEGDLANVETHNSYRAATRPGELFVRYSAFPNDFRINPDGSVRPDTYVTTQTDSTLVPSGLAAVARYALPNPTPARHRFVLSPPPLTGIYCSTSTPQYGQAGGGVEVRFDRPLQPGTALGPQPIPER